MHAHVDMRGRPYRRGELSKKEQLDDRDALHGVPYRCELRECLASQLPPRSRPAVHDELGGDASVMRMAAWASHENRWTTSAFASASSTQRLCRDRRVEHGDALRCRRRPRHLVSARTRQGFFSVSMPPIVNITTNVVEGQG